MYRFGEPVLEIEDTLKRKSKGKAVYVLQEWLHHYDFETSLDGDFGPATQGRVKELQAFWGMDVTGEVTPEFFEMIVDPLRTCVEYVSEKEDLREAVLETALMFRAQGAVEIGGENRGPWVRSVMDGHHGKKWEWCMGFVNWVMRHNQQIHKETLWPRTYSCTAGKKYAVKEKFFVEGKDALEKGLAPGHIFLERSTTPGKWKHTGFVWEMNEEDGTFTTIEANYNRKVGSRRLSKFKRLGFIIY